MPLAALGGITVVVALGLIDLAEVRRIGRFDRTDLVLALVTAAGVIWIGMLAGILLVILLSLLDVARRTRGAEPDDAGARAGDEHLPERRHGGDRTD